MKNKKIYLNLILILFYFAIFGIFFSLIEGFFNYLFISALLAYLFNPLVSFMESKLKVKRILAIILIFLLLFLVFLLIVLPALFRIFTEFQSLYMVMSKIDYKAKLLGWYETITGWLSSLPLPSSVKIYLTKEKIKDYLLKNDYFNKMSVAFAKNSKKFMGKLFYWLTNNFALFFSSILNLFLIPVFLFYFLVDYEEIKTFFSSLFPGAWRLKVAPYIKETDYILSSFFRGQIIVAMFIGVGMSLILLFLRIDFGFIIGPLAGLANLVPYLGVIVGLIPSLAIIFFKFGFSKLALWKLGGVILGFSFLQMIDGFLLSPKIIGEAVSLHPLAVMLAIMVGGSIGGFWGMIFAIPATAIIRMIYFKIIFPQIDKITV